MTDTRLKEDDQRLLKKTKSLLRYALISWWAYILIIVLTGLFWAVSLPVGWLASNGPLYNHWVEFLRNVAPSLAAAFFIVLCTDFISRKHMEKLFDEQKEGAVTIQHAFDWGLRLYPNHHVIERREAVLDKYLRPGDTIRILSGRGKPWLDGTEDILERIVKDGVTAQVIVFSPQLYAEDALAALPGNGTRYRRAFEYVSEQQKFTRYRNTGEELISFHANIKKSLDGLDTEKRARITVRFTGIVPLCEFFVIGDKCSHGSVPMHTKTRRDSFSIQTFRGLRCGNDNVKDFIKEFEYFWDPEHSISEQEYFDRYAGVKHYAPSAR